MEPKQGRSRRGHHSLYFPTTPVHPGNEDDLNAGRGMDAPADDTVGPDLSDAELQPNLQPHNIH